MKKRILLYLLFGVTTFMFSQNKNEKAIIEVDGVCMMCKNRIEKESLKTKGVKSAIWNLESRELKLIFDARKTNIDSIKKKIITVGHDTKLLKSTIDSYNAVPLCCKYRDDEVFKGKHPEEN